MTSTTSQPRKPILLFAAHALVLALLLGFWPSARDLYPDAFRSGISALLERGDPQALTVRPGALRDDPPVDTFVEGLDPDSREPSWRLAFSTIRMGYWPTAVLFALLFATPMPPRRRALALLAGFVWMAAWSAVRISIDVARAQAELARGGAEASAEGPVLLLRAASEVASSNILEIAMVLLAWVVLANPQRVLRSGALARVLGTPGGRRPGGGGPSAASP